MLLRLAVPMKERWTAIALPPSFRLDDDFAQELNEGLRLSATPGQSKCGCFVIEPLSPRVKSPSFYELGFANGTTAVILLRENYGA